jgi:hypothetical protein
MKSGTVGSKLLEVGVLMLLPDEQELLPAESQRNSLANPIFPRDTDSLSVSMTGDMVLSSGEVM